MGLPSYVINFDELVEPMKKALSEADIKVDTSDISLDSSHINLDTSGIEGQIASLKESLDGINSDTSLINTTTENILNTLIEHNDTLDVQMEDIRDKVSSMVNTLVRIYNLLVTMNDDGENSRVEQDGKQRMIGATMEIRGEVIPYHTNFVFEDDTLITGFTISQSAWNINDKWNLMVGDFPLMDNIYTKMRGEHKQLSRFMAVPAGTEIVFNYDNSASANSKYVWIDLEYIELLPPPPPPPPPPEPEPEPEPEEPPVDDGTIDTGDIHNEWDLAIVLRWEGGVDTDLDLHAEVDGWEVNYSNEEVDAGNGDKAYLNYDFTSHDDADAWETEPEIITVKGFKGKRVYVKVINFDGGPITKNAEVEIIRKTEDGSTSSTKHVISPSNLQGNGTEHFVTSITV
jgi:hypothetical protein